MAALPLSSYSHNVLLALPAELRISILEYTTQPHPGLHRSLCSCNDCSRYCQILHPGNPVTLLHSIPPAICRVNRQLRREALSVWASRITLDISVFSLIETLDWLDLFGDVLVPYIRHFVLPAMHVVLKGAVQLKCQCHCKRALLESDLRAVVTLYASTTRFAALKEGVEYILDRKPLQVKYFTGFELRMMVSGVMAREKMRNGESIKKWKGMFGEQWLAEVQKMKAVCVRRRMGSAQYSDAWRCMQL